MILLTCINPRLKWICALGSHIGVKMTIFGITPKVKPGWNISWECSIPLKPISLFLWVNKEGLCHGIRVWVHLIWVISFFMIFGMDEKEKLISLISLALNFFKLESLLFLIIYPNKLIILTFINPPLTWICALGPHIRVKITIIGLEQKDTLYHPFQKS